MKCKYCGKDVRPVGPNLESDDNGYNCPASVSKKTCYYTRWFALYSLRP